MGQPQMNEVLRALLTLTVRLYPNKVKTYSRKSLYGLLSKLEDPIARESVKQFIKDKRIKK